MLLPGDVVPENTLQRPSNSSAPLKLGPGLRHIPAATITPILAGELCVDRNKNALWVEHSGGKVSSSQAMSSAGDYGQHADEGTVYPKCRRYRHCNRASLISRLFPLPNNPSYRPSHIATSFLSGSDEEDTASSDLRLPSLYARLAGQQAHGSRTRVRKSLHR